jgi:hypothetical protein
LLVIAIRLFALAISPHGHQHLRRVVYRRAADRICAATVSAAIMPSTKACANPLPDE